MVEIKVWKMGSKICDDFSIICLRGGGGSNPQNHKESSSNTTNEGVTRRFKFTETYVFSQKVTFNFCKIEKKKTKIFKDGFQIFRYLQR